MHLLRNAVSIPNSKTASGAVARLKIRDPRESIAAVNVSPIGKGGSVAAMVLASQ